jgi:hypothetical protein
MLNMNELKFNSQICTTNAQSQRLLELGLKPETADMSYYKEEPRLDPYEEMECPYDGIVFPAWSLHRLIEMCNKTQFGMTISIYNSQVSADGDLFELLDDTYDNLISIIEWLIKRGRFNKEYLK